MADPLSIAASAFAVLQIGAACAKSLLSIIQSIRDAPEELMILSNEVTSLNAIIDEARQVSGSLAAGGSSTSQFNETFERLLKEAEDTLRSLNTLASKYKSKSRAIQSLWWLRQKTLVNKYFVRLRNIRGNMDSLLTSQTASVLFNLHQYRRNNLTRILANAKISNHTLRISMKIDSLKSVCEQMSQQVDSSHSTPETIIKYLLPQPGSLDGEDNSSSSISNSRVQPDQGKIFGFTSSLVNNKKGNASVASRSAVRSTPESLAPSYGFPKSVICLGMYKQINCEGTCDCSCHSNYRCRTPLLLRNLIGTLVLGYTGSSVLRPKCEKSTCQNRTGQSFQLTYCFPQWFLERAIHIVAAITYTGTPMFGLVVRRRVGWGSEDTILRFALTGNTVGVKSLLDVGTASMTDVDPNHGRSALYVSFREKILIKF
jgi:hypothetical protein